MIIYDENTLSAADIKKIESYLAIKYGITLDKSGGGSNGDFRACDNSMIWDMSDHDDYHNDVIGIARDDVSGLNQLQSYQSDDSTRIYLSDLASENLTNLGSFTSDKQFVLMGHNNAKLNSTGSTEFPSGLGIISRIDREWKITNTAFNGTFSIDTYINSSPINPADLRVLIDDDGDFTNATMINPLISFSAGVVTISDISTGAIPMNSTRYLTIVSMNQATPLPVSMTNFTATMEGRFVRLDWQTQSEINNDYFTVERSTDLAKWDFIKSIDGTGNSTSIQYYSCYDFSPVLGNAYYRLIQTDVNGQSTYSYPISIFNTDKKQYTVQYPSNGDKAIIITGDIHAIDAVVLVNHIGQQVGNYKPNAEVGDNTLIMDASQLEMGVYFIKLTSECSTLATEKIFIY